MMTPQQLEELNAVKLARLFHDTYERLAPEFGYETREETRAFDEATPNGKLMIAVCEKVTEALAVPELIEGIECLKEMLLVLLGDDDMEVTLGTAIRFMKAKEKSPAWIQEMLR